MKALKNINLVTHPFNTCEEKGFQNLKYIEHRKQVSVLRIPIDIQVCAHIAYILIHTTYQLPLVNTIFRSTSIIYIRYLTGVQVSDMQVKKIYCNQNSMYSIFIYF